MHSATSPTPSQEEPVPSEPLRRRRWRRWLVLSPVILVLGAALLVAGLYLSRETTLHPLVERLAPGLAERYGYALDIDDLSGSWFDELQVEGLRLSSLEGGPITSLTGDDVRLELDWSTWWRPGLRRIVGRGLDLTLDFTAPSDGEEPTPLPEHLPLLDAEGVSVEARLPEDRILVARGASLKIDPQGTGERIRLQASEGRWPAPAGDLDLWPLDLDLVYRGGLLEIDQLTAGEDFALSAESPAGDAADQVDLRRFHQERATWDLGLAALDGVLRLQGELAPESLNLQLAGLGLDPSKLDPLLAPESRGQIGGTLTLDASFRMPMTSPAATGSGADLLATLEAKVELSASPLVISGRVIDQVQGTASLADGILRSPGLEATRGENRLNATEVSIPLAGPGGGTDLATLLDQGRGAFQLDARDLPAVMALGGTPVEETVPRHQLTLRGEMGDGAFRLAEGLLTVPDGRVEIERGIFRVRSRAGDRDDVAAELEIDLDVAARADLASLRPLGVLFQTEPWSGSLKADVVARGTWPRIEGQADIHGRTVAVAGTQLGRVDARASADGERLQVPTLTAQGEWGRLEGSGAIHLARQELENVVLDADVDHLVALLPGSPFSGGLTLRVRGDGPLASPRGTFRLEAPRLEIPRLETPRLEMGEGAAPLENVLLLGSAKDGRVEVETLRASTTLGTGPSPAQVTAEAAGSAEGLFEEGPMSFEITRLDLRQGDGNDDASLALTAPATGSYRADPFELRLDAVELEGSAGLLHFSLSPEGRHTVVSATAENLDPMALAASFLPAGYRITGIDAQIDGVLGPALLSGQALETLPPGDLRLDLKGSVATLEIPGIGAPLEVRGTVSMAGETLKLEQVQALQEGRPALDISGSLPLAALSQDSAQGGTASQRGSAGMDLQGRVFLPELDRLEVAAETFLSGHLEAAFDLQGRLLAPRGTVEVEASALELVTATPTGATTFGPGRLESTVRLEREIHLDRLTLAVPQQASVDGSGSFRLPQDFAACLDRETRAAATAPPEPPAPFATCLGETAIDLQARLDFPTLGWLRPWLPGVRRLGGTAEGTLAIAGTLGDPRFDGAVTLADASLRTEDGAMSMDELAGTLRFDGEVLSTEDLTGKLGASPATLAGRITLAEPATELDLTIKGENLLLLRSADLRLRADADLQISGTLDQPVVEGELALRNSRVAQRIDLLSLLGSGSQPPSAAEGLELFSFRDPPLSKMRLNVRIRSREPVEVLSNLARGSARAELHLGGHGEVPLPSGRIFVEPTRIKLPSGSLELTGGTITFREANPFLPDLALSGSTRLRGYDITVQIRGDLEAPEVILSSSPPLPNGSLLTLVLTGQLPAGATSRQAAQSVALFLARDFISRWSDRDWDDESFLDRFEVVTGRDVSRDGVETLEATFLLDEDVLFDDSRLYLVTERDTFEDYNYGLRLQVRFGTGEGTSQP